MARSMTRFPLMCVTCLVWGVSSVVAAPDTSGTYKGYACTKNCSGHKAGYVWAQKKGVTRRDQCTGRSRSFVEGCYAWVMEQKTERDFFPDTPLSTKDGHAAP